MSRHRYFNHGFTISGKRYCRQSVISCSDQNKLVCPFSYSGAATPELVEDYFQKYLLPNIPPNSTIILDNTSVHNKTRLQELCHKCQVNMLFLPPYSPDLNPIEKIWALIKRHLRNYYNNSLSFLDNPDLSIRKYTKQWI